MLRYFMFLFLAIVSSSKVYVFYQEKNALTLKEQVSKIAKDVNLLKIEWAYLNQHPRLQKLSNYVKNWSPVNQNQIKVLMPKKKDVSKNKQEKTKK